MLLHDCWSGARSAIARKSSFWRASPRCSSTCEGLRDPVLQPSLPQWRLVAAHSSPKPTHPARPQDCKQRLARMFKLRSMIARRPNECLAAVLLCSCCLLTSRNRHCPLPCEYSGRLTSATHLRHAAVTRLFKLAPTRFHMEKESFSF